MKGRNGILTFGESTDSTYHHVEVAECVSIGSLRICGLHRPQHLFRRRFIRAIGRSPFLFPIGLYRYHTHQPIRELRMNPIKPTVHRGHAKPSRLMQSGISSDALNRPCSGRLGVSHSYLSDRSLGKGARDVKIPVDVILCLI